MYGIVPIRKPLLTGKSQRLISHLTKNILMRFGHVFPHKKWNYHFKKTAFFYFLGLSLFNINICLVIWNKHERQKCKTIRNQEGLCTKLLVQNRNSHCLLQEDSTWSMVLQESSLPPSSQAVCVHSLTFNTDPNHHTQWGSLSTSAQRKRR